jgi:rod shape-determining protein MreC
MNLKSINSDLMQQVAVLEQELRSTKQEVDFLTKKVYPTDIHRFKESYPNTYSFLPAQVVNKQIARLNNNFITLNRGSLSGVERDMGVLSPTGIVGVVINVTPHFSRVIPILNPKTQPSCIIKRTNYSGILSWDGKDPRYSSLKELPQHAEFNIGDTIVTSGFSHVFPKGVPVGTIENTFKKKGENYNSVTVKLFTNFSTLSEVLIVVNESKDEQLNIEKGETE